VAKTNIETLSGSVPTVQANLSAEHVVVLSHGIFVDSNENGRFPRLAALLSQRGLGSIAPDLPGHGSSPIASRDTTVSDMALTLRDVLGWTFEHCSEVSLVASSFSGALLSLIYDQGLGGQLSRLVMLNPVLDFDNVFLHAAMPEMAESFSPEGFDELASTGLFRPVPQFQMNREFVFEMQRFDVPEAYLRVDKPHLVLHGTSDELVSYNRATEIISANPAAEFVPVPGGVHAFSQSGHEPEVWDRVVAYLDN
jgi:pimeloyl-ACP methyl ester carboxylesterase